MNLRALSESVKNNPVAVGKAVSAVAAVAAIVGVAHPSADQIAAVSAFIVAANSLLAVVVRSKVVPMRKLPAVPVDESVHPSVPE